MLCYVTKSENRSSMVELPTRRCEGSVHAGENAIVLRSQRRYKRQARVVVRTENGTARCRRSDTP